MFYKDMTFYDLCREYIRLRNTISECNQRKGMDVFTDAIEEDLERVQSEMADRLVDKATFESECRDENIQLKKDLSNIKYRIQTIAETM